MLVQWDPDDHEFTCVCCGEIWGRETRREWLDRIKSEAAAMISEPAKLGRPSRADTILDLLTGGRQMTTAEIAVALGLAENTVGGTRWGLHRASRLVLTRTVGGHVWSVPLDDLAEAS